MAHVSDLIAAARTRIENLTPQQAAQEIERGDVLVVDLREAAERATTGAIPGAIAVPRGMLEFHADAATPYYREEFVPSRRIVLYCASGGRSALAGSALRDLGFDDVAHINGGLRAWTAAGLDVAPSEP